MASLRHEIPDELNHNEERWMKIFSKRSFVACLCMATIAFLNYKFLAFLGIGILGIIIGIVLVLLVYIVTSIHIPETWTVTGAGLTLDVYILRYLIRRNNQVIYVKGYRPYEEEDE